MIYMAVVHYKKGALSAFEMAIWLLIWVLVIFAVAFPELLRTYAQTFAVSRLFDLLVAGGFIVVITIISVGYIKTKKLEKKIEDLVRRDALKQK